MKSVNLFNKNIKIREYDCKHFKENEVKRFNFPRVSLFIQTTPNCQSNCPFCIYKDNKKSIFDIEKFETIIKEISIRDDLIIRKLNFTGGEPCLDFNLFEEQVNVVKNNLSHRQETEITLNTNGINLLKVLRFQDVFDSIGLSRHHYLDDKNKETFGGGYVPDADIIKEFNNNLNEKGVLQLRYKLY